MSFIINKYKQKKYFVDAFLFFLVSGGALLVYSKLWGVSDRSGGNLLFQLVSLSIYGWAFINLITIYKYKCLNILHQTYPLLILICACLISTTWSVEPMTTFRRSIALFLTYIFCIYLVSRYELDELLYITFLVCSLIAIFGLIAVAIPGWGINTDSKTYSTAIRGLSGHKNDFGRYVAIGLLACFYLFYCRSISKKLLRLFFALLFILLILSQSKTPFAVVMVVILFIPLSRLYVIGKFNLRTKSVLPILFRVLIFAFTIPICLIFLTYMVGSILEFLGKDLTLTGRTFIWQWALDFAEQKKWLGAGYRTFWVDSWGTYTFWETDITIGNGHNGFIDVYLESGYLGLMIYIFFIFSFLNRCMLNPHILINYTVERTFAFSLILFYLVYSITEQVTLEQSELLWMLIMIFYMAMSKYKMVKSAEIPYKKKWRKY